MEKIRDNGFGIIEDAPEMSFEEGLEQARKYGKEQEYLRLIKEDWDVEPALAECQVPLLIDGQEYVAGDITESNELAEKKAELLYYAKQHATGEGMQSGYNWLRDAFEEYIELTDSTPGYGMGGQPGSMHNREVLAKRICLELGNHVGGQHVIDADQEAKLRQTLNEIVADESRSIALKI